MELKEIVKILLREAQAKRREQHKIVKQIHSKLNVIDTIEDVIQINELEYIDGKISAYLEVLTEIELREV